MQNKSRVKHAAGGKHTCRTDRPAAASLMSAVLISAKSPEPGNPATMLTLDVAPS